MVEKFCGLINKLLCLFTLSKYRTSCDHFYFSSQRNLRQKLIKERHKLMELIFTALCFNAKIKDGSFR